MDDDKKQRQIAAARAIIGLAESKLSRMGAGNAPVHSLSSIAGYEIAAAKVIHFVLNPKAYVDTSAAPEGVEQHGSLIYAMLKDAREKVNVDEWNPEFIARWDAVLALGAPKVAGPQS